VFARESARERERERVRAPATPCNFQQSSPAAASGLSGPIGSLRENVLYFRACARTRAPSSSSTPSSASSVVAASDVCIGCRHTDDSRLFIDSCLNKNLKLRAECKGLMVQQFVTKYEALTPNYLARWINRSDARRSALNTSGGDEGSPTRRDGDSPTGNMSPTTSPQFLSSK
jgi:hypothetical protein